MSDLSFTHTQTHICNSSCVRYEMHFNGIFLVLSLLRCFQLHLGVESIRAPELLFQPSMIGSPEAGIVETIDYVLKQFSTDEQLLLAQNIFLTGGCANLKGKLNNNLMLNRLKSFSIFLFLMTQV